MGDYLRKSMDGVLGDGSHILGLRQFPVDISPLHPVSQPDDTSSQLVTDQEHKCSSCSVIRLYRPAPSFKNI
jgi:hypothetical protein